MAVTNYYSVDGQLLGEATGGNRTDYIPDALGSIVQTMDVSSGLVDSYSYKPFGAMLSHVGSHPAPAFQWVGALGYRTTGRDRAGRYIRARHYDELAGRWTTVDPIRSSEPDYLYALANPTTYFDPSGWFTYKITQQARRDDTCGSASVVIQWVLEGSEKTFDGWIVQKIVNDSSALVCAKKDVSSAFNCKPSPVYYERWRVKNGQIGLEMNATTIDWNSGFDIWGINGTGACTHGTISKTGDAWLVPVGSLTGTWFYTGQQGHNNCAIDLPTSQNVTGLTGKSLVHRVLSTTHACCCAKDSPYTSCGKGDYMKEESIAYY